MLFRFYFGAMYRHRAFSGDPHPGNSMLLDDGRMAFLDFGLFKRHLGARRPSASSRSSGSAWRAAART